MFYERVIFTSKIFFFVVDTEEIFLNFHFFPKTKTKTKKPNVVTFSYCQLQHRRENFFSILVSSPFCHRKGNDTGVKISLGRC